MQGVITSNPESSTVNSSINEESNGKPRLKLNFPRKTLVSAKLWIKDPLTGLSDNSVLDHHMNLPSVCIRQ